MSEIIKIKTVGIWIFIIPVFSINLCLILIQAFDPNHSPFAFGDSLSNPELRAAHDHLSLLIPYIDGSASISRVVRVYPNSIIFKFSMFTTAVLLIYYWRLNKSLIFNINSNGHKLLRKMYILGVSSAICLILHSIFLGVKFDYKIFKLLRRIVLISFIVFELCAQAILIKILFDFKKILNNYIDEKVLNLKKIIISILIVLAIIILPFLPFNNLKLLKHALEWNYFIGVNSFYLLTYFMWKRN